MRPLFALSTLFLVASAGPTMARDYPWCARTNGNGPIGDCSFVSYAQCLATVSGQDGDCSPNPLMSVPPASPSEPRTRRVR